LPAASLLCEITHATALPGGCNVTPRSQAASNPTPRKQDAVKRITGDELPDFYNILLERPKDDPDGYDVLCVDAAAKVGRLGISGWGTWSRMAGMGCQRLGMADCVRCRQVRCWIAVGRMLSPAPCTYAPPRTGRVCVAHEPQLHPQLPGSHHGLRRPPHHRALHAAPRARG